LYVEDESVASVDEAGAADDTEDTASSWVPHNVACEVGEANSLNSGVVASSSGVEDPQSDRPSFVSTVSAVPEEVDSSSPDSESCEHADSSGVWDDDVTEISVGLSGAGDVSRSLVRTQAVFNLDSGTFPSTLAGGVFGRCFIEVWARIPLAWMESAEVVRVFCFLVLDMLFCTAVDAYYE